MNLGRVGVVGRFKPLHIGGALMLEAICEQADTVIIGIGSANKYNARNPFTADESEAMVHALLSERFDNYKVVHIDDYAQVPEYSDGQRWRQDVLEKFGDLDHFVSGNEYVYNLMGEDYKMIHPASLIPKEKHIMIRATMVRMAMVTNEDWKAMVPGPVVRYLDGQDLVERFRDEYGLETIAMNAATGYWLPEDSDQEREHTYER